MKFLAALSRIISLILISSMFVVVFLFANISATQNDNDLYINNIVQKLNKEIEVKITQNPQLSYSSNPYDYINGSVAYEELVKCDPNIIPSLINKISTSNNDGLIEYILSIAAEEIMKVDIKTIENGKYKWSEAKGMVKSLINLSRDMEKNIDLITSSDLTKEEKKNQIDKLGILASPYLADSEYASTDERLVKKCKNINTYLCEIS